MDREQRRREKSGGKEKKRHERILKKEKWKRRVRERMIRGYCRRK